jgi:hypothetical protein
MSMINDIKLRLYCLEARLKSITDFDFSEDMQLRISQQVQCTIVLAQLMAEIRALRKLLLPGAKL